MAKYYTPKLTETQYQHLLDAISQYENDLYDAYQECTDEHGNTVANSKEYKKYKLNKSLYIYLFEYLVQNNYNEMTHGKT